MKNIALCTLILGLTFCSCNQSNQAAATTVSQAEKPTISKASSDKEEIQNLIRKVLSWAESKNSIELLPVTTDSKDSVYIGFDLTKHKQNLEKLKSTGLFAQEFIDNYNQIILTLDKGLRNGKYAQWLVGDLPTIIFANDVDPWTEGQERPYDNPNPWDYIEVEVIQLSKDKGELSWKWGNLKENTDPSWKDIKYNFRVVKENGAWKISYMHGFDFKESTRKDGQL